MQPRALSELIPGILEIDPILGIDAIFDDIGAILDDIGAILDMGEIEIICVELSISDISVFVMSAGMPDPLMSILFFIPVMLIEEVSDDIGEDPLSPEEVVSSPSPVPALRMLSGRHSKRPSPLAKRLSTQCVNAPVLK